MRDGIHISADIYMPAKPGWKGPCILIFTPYDNTMDFLIQYSKFFIKAEYAYMIVDVRGRGDSDGKFDPLEMGKDEYDCIDWISSQEWSNQKIGMMGASYLGSTQWAAAKEQHPNLKTIIPTAAAGNIWQETYYVNGLPCLWELPWLNAVSGRTLQWNTAKQMDWKEICFHLPLITMDEKMGRKIPMWKKMLKHSTFDDFWKSYKFSSQDFSKINLPVLHITGWFDGDQIGALFFYNGMINHSSAKENQYLLIGPWDHESSYRPQQKVGKKDFGEKSVLNIAKIHIEWFDYWLKNKRNEVPNWPKTMVFQTGSQKWRKFQNTWKELVTKDEKLEFFLKSQGSANTANGNGQLILKPTNDAPFDQYIYDPNDPLLVGDFYTYSKSYDLSSRDFDNRDDALFYISNPFEKTVNLIGEPILEFYGSSNCLDTDWVTLLSIVQKDGTLMHFRSEDFHGGVLRARFRNSFEKPELLVPGKIYKFTIKLNAICHQLQPGERIRLMINSSAFPVYARNNNTGNNIATDTEIKIATNRIYHSEKYPSKLIFSTLNLED